MPTFSLNGKTMTVPPGTTILEAALTAGTEIPYYCYHPGLPVEGSCRMCQVEVERSPKLLVACATPVAEGMVVRSGGAKVEKARRAVLEFYLLNHPLDCPVCDKGGECPLQDYTMRFGPGGSRYTEPKVKRVKHRKIGPYIVFDAERCILCTRCVRFCRDVVGTGELGIVFRGAQSEIDLFPGKELDNRYSGNVIDLCPVGALTSERYRFQARPWDLVKQEPSVCPGCSRGCSTVLDVRHLERKGPEILRVRPRHNPDVNGYWMCDIGRFDYHWVEGDRRQRQPSIGRAASSRTVPWADALMAVNDAVVAAGGAAAVRFFASAHASLEELFVLRQIAAGTGGVTLGWRHREKPQHAKTKFTIPSVDAPNVRGARDLGLITAESGAPADVSKLKAAVAAGGVKVLYVFDPGPDGSIGETDWIIAARTAGKIGTLIVQAVLKTPLSDAADIVLPGSS
ncbi:MAG: 2Fe-2S iron-sulfur cluster-binding protein, partial [Candidatus Methylomirabilales bacterium]